MDYSLYLSRQELKALRALLEQGPTEPRVLDQVYEKVTHILEQADKPEPESKEPASVEQCKKTGHHGVFLNREGYCEGCGYLAIFDD